MKLISVKEYAKLIGKNEKTVYRMIKENRVEAVKDNGIYSLNVDKNLLKVISKTQKALEEAKAVLNSMDETSIKTQSKAISKKPVTKTKKVTSKVIKKVIPKSKKASPKVVKKNMPTKSKPVKRIVKKSVIKKPTVKRVIKKRK